VNFLAFLGMWGKMILMRWKFSDLHSALVSGIVVSLASADMSFSQITTNLSTGYFNLADGYEVGFEVDGQPNYPNGGWNSSDPYNPGPPATGARSLVQFFNFYTFGIPQDGNNSVLFGGYANQARKPGIPNSSIYNNFTPSASASSDVVFFSMDFALYKPAPEFSQNRDSFGITLWDGFGQNSLLEFNFDPKADWLVNDNSYGFSWIRDGQSQTNNPALLSPTWIFGANSLYRMEVSLSGEFFTAEVKTLNIETNGIGAVTNYSVVQSLTLISSGEIGAGLDVQDFGAISLDWHLESGDPQDPGDRFLVINQVSVTTVPEPSTLLLVVGFGSMLLGFSTIRGRWAVFKGRKM
jgi:hypothetical protein